jgi:hypothetical protein
LEEWESENFIKEKLDDDRFKWQLRPTPLRSQQELEQQAQQQAAAAKEAEEANLRIIKKPNR